MNQHAYYSGNDFGGYQFISLNEVIDNFTATYVGEGKLLQRTLRADVSFHAHRALQELSYDTLKSCKSQEIEVNPSLTMPLPHDYVNYVKLSWVDNSGIEHIIYPTSKTSNPTPIRQNDDGDYTLTAVGTLTENSATVVLDDEYPEILVGMQVIAPSIPIDGNANTTTANAGYLGITRVLSTSNSGGITTITLADELGTNVEATWGTGAATNSQETLTFLPTYQALPGLVQPTTWPSAQLNPHLTDATGPSDVFLQEETNHIVESLTWDTSDPKILAASASDISDIKVGMKVSHKDFLTGTVVTDVNGAYITVSNTASIAAASASGEVTFSSGEIVSDTFTNYKTHKPSENNINDYQDYQNDIYWPNEGKRYGLDPQHAQINGSYYIDCVGGKIHFSSNLSGKTVILKYISDHLGTEEETVVPKLAEEAIYKWIAHGCLSAKMGVPEYIINRFKKERFAETRKAKLRLSNIKLEEITQILRGKSKQIKH
jgi:hypothetical protein